MKTILVLLLSLFYLSASAANELQLSYTGNYTVLVKSNMPCSSLVQLQWKVTGGQIKDSVFLLAANASKSLVLTNLQAGSIVKAEGYSTCASYVVATLQISTTLAVGPSLKLSKTTEGITFQFSEKGILEKSANGVTFYAIGEFDKVAIDRVPYLVNYYRLKVGGTYSPIYRMTYEGRVYGVYTLLGQLIAVTRDIDQYRGGRYIIL